MRWVQLQKAHTDAVLPQACAVKMHILPPSGERRSLHFKEKMRSLKMQVGMRVMGSLGHEIEIMIVRTKLY